MTRRIGYSQAFGVLPRFMFVGQLDVILNHLISSMSFSDQTSKFSESRRDMLFAFTRFLVINAYIILLLLFHLTAKRTYLLV